MAKGWLNNKPLLRILSLAVAICIWIYVVITQDPPRSNHVDSVEIICGLSQYQLNEGLNIISKSSDNVSFTANGKRSLVTGVRGSYYAKLNLDSITQPGKYNITPEISKPDSVEITGVNPSVVEIYVDKYVSSLVPVVVKTTGTLPKDLVVIDMSTETQQIAVTLPSLALEQIAYAGLNVELASLTGPDTVSCPVALYDSNDNVVSVKNVTLDKKNVSVKVNAEKYKTVNINPVISAEGTAMNGFTAHATPAVADIYGDKTALESITALNTQPIALKQPPELNKDYQTQLILPEGIHLKDGTTDAVTVQFKQS